MTKTILILAIAAAFVAGTLASTTMIEATEKNKPTVTEERDNLFITDVSADIGQNVVLLDNAGIGGTSSVELTWRLPHNCGLIRVDGTAPTLTFTPIIDGGELGGNPSHSDQSNIGALVLTAVEGDPCLVQSTGGNYISISTVGSTKKG